MSAPDTDPADLPIVRPLPRGTFVALVVFAFFVLTVNLASVAAIVYISTQTTRTVPAILGALAMAGFDRLMTLGERAFRWTRGVPDRLD